MVICAETVTIVIWNSDTCRLLSTHSVNKPVDKLWISKVIRDEMVAQRGVDCAEMVAPLR